jgi:hypothetical protein
VESQGRYPTRSNTRVADVCRYQNDGTDRITASKFIERAEAEADGWESEVDRAIERYLETGDLEQMRLLADKVAADISRMCDRIRTGQLKASFEGKVTE